MQEKRVPASLQQTVFRKKMLKSPRNLFIALTLATAFMLPSVAVKADVSGALKAADAKN